MEKARRSLRRSATRLISTDESESDLAVALQEWRRVKGAASSFADVQREAAEFLMKWSLKEENRAIKDAAFHLNELVRLWANAQSHFSSELQGAIEEMNSMRDAYKSVKEAEKSASSCREKEEKIKKELQAACRWRKGGDVRLLQHNLEEATRNRQQAEQRANEVKLEYEAAKMLRFKKAMHLLARSYLDMGQACTLVFEAHEDIVKKIPDGCDIAPSQLPFLSYDGAPYTRQRVDVVRRRMSEIVGASSSSSSSCESSRANQQRRRASDTIAHQNHSAPIGCFSFPARNFHPSNTDPPPPYAP